MNLIDDEGNLFGVVNVVDALVVLFALAVVAAGAAFVLQPDSTQPDEPNLGTTNVTVDLGTQPDYIATAIDEGDTYSPSTNTQLTITDVYVSPRDDATAVVLRATLQGPVTEDTLSYSGAPPRLGRVLAIQTDTYQVQGTIRDVGGSNQLQTGNTPIVLRTMMSAEEAADLNAGERIRSGGRTVATVQDVSIYGTQNPEKRLVYLGLSLRTLNYEGLPHFGNTIVREGTSLSIYTDTDAVEGTVRRVGAAQLGHPHHADRHTADGGRDARVRRQC
ncbi:DUF4330 family protein [Halospeciosus flavus]|uniref:DUF4330 family protein n=1 Tax=Halospeciosus flavus TaxID=3032283 RepID=UPI003607377C